MTPEQYVQDKARGSGSSFYYAFIFLPVAVELSVSAFTVSGSGTAELVFDLNAEEWIGLGELSSGLISDVNMASRIRGRATSG